MPVPPLTCQDENQFILSSIQNSSFLFFMRLAEKITNFQNFVKMPLNLNEHRYNC